MSNEKFIITFTGSLYGLRTAKNFLLAVKQLVKDNPEIENELEIRFVGTGFRQTIETVKILGLQKMVTIKGYVSHKEALRYMLDSDFLLIIVGSQEDYTLTGKLFEYLASERLILALAPVKGEAAKIINEHKAGIVVDPENVDTVKHAILELLQDSKRFWKWIGIH